MTHHIADRVQFVFDASDEELVTKFRASDALMFLSSLEGFGMVNIEAMAYGLPVIASDIAAHRELFAEGRGGCLVPLDDAPMVADTVTSLFDDPALYRRISEQAMKASADYEWDVDQVTNLLHGA